MKKIKKNKVVILIFLIILTEICVTFFSLSKYTSQNINSDSTRAAAFIFKIDSESNNIVNIDCNETNTKTYSLKITNKDENGNISEVTTSYKIVINLEEKLPEGVEMSLQDKDGNEVKCVMSEDKLSYIFNNVGTLAAGIEDDQEVKLKFLVDVDNVKNFIGKKVSINVYGEQVN
jgi:uncharacterized protein YpmB